MQFDSENRTTSLSTTVLVFANVIQNVLVKSDVQVKKQSQSMFELEFI